MKGITIFFLRAKRWQIFILVFGVYFVGQMALVGSILASPRSQEVFSKGGLLAGLVMTLSPLGLSGVEDEVGVLSRCSHLPTFLFRFLHCDFSKLQSRFIRTHNSIAPLRHGLHVLSLVFRV